MLLCEGFAGTHDFVGARGGGVGSFREVGRSVRVGALGGGFGLFGHLVRDRRAFVQMVGLVLVSGPGLPVVTPSQLGLEEVGADDGDFAEKEFACDGVGVGVIENSPDGDLPSVMIRGSVRECVSPRARDTRRKGRMGVVELTRSSSCLLACSITAG